jgi:hypothetical protein
MPDDYASMLLFARCMTAMFELLARRSPAYKDRTEALHRTKRQRLRFGIFFRFRIVLTHCWEDGIISALSRLRLLTKLKKQIPRELKLVRNEK